MPGMLSGRTLSFTELITGNIFSTNGILGMPTKVLGETLIVFLLFPLTDLFGGDVEAPANVPSSGVINKLFDRWTWRDCCTAGETDESESELSMIDLSIAGALIDDSTPESETFFLSLIRSRDLLDSLKRS